MDGTVTLRNLGVIAVLSQNDKINTKDDYFTIYSPTALRGIARLIYYGEGREHNIVKISNCIRDAKAFITTCMNEIYTENEESTDANFMRKLALSSKHQICNRMITALEKSQDGLKSLKVTYKDDASCTSKLDCLLYEVQDFLTTTRVVCEQSSRVLLK